MVHFTKTPLCCQLSSQSPLSVIVNQKRRTTLKSWATNKMGWCPYHCIRCEKCEIDNGWYIEWGPTHMFVAAVGCDKTELGCECTPSICFECFFKEYDPQRKDVIKGMTVECSGWYGDDGCWCDKCSPGKLETWKSETMKRCRETYGDYLFSDSESSDSDSENK